MLICNLSDIKYNYEFEKLSRLFLPFEKITVVNQMQSGERLAVCFESENGNLKASLCLNGKYAEKTDTVNKTDTDYKKECERKLSVCLFNCFYEITGYKPPFGILTGVRPARLYKTTEEELGEEGAKDFFKNKLLVSDNKISLCRETKAAEEKIISLSKSNSFSLYISIPFCPTRCSYCSFVSHSVESAKGLIDEYVKKLCEELVLTAKAAKEFNLKLMTVYMGGGTPTTLCADQLTEIFDTLRQNFDLSGVSEFTVEAGRPDTVTKEKLIAIKNAKATRISINPQTMSDEVLKKIGRRHTAKQTEEAFYLAREYGLDNINSDLIAGLPGDTFSSFCETLEKVNLLNPESITVHSLSAKRASNLSSSGFFPDMQNWDTALKMVDYSYNFLKQNGYFPYYMYRQSKTVGNLENVGYSKKGFEGLYNVYIMDETHTIMSCGASAVTKLREYGGTDIKRIFNYKYPYEYIGKFDEQNERKRGIKDFYENHAERNK